MRFVPDGPRIPDELLIARDEGRVVFFCGSGVSRARAGLPDFPGLAREVLGCLHVSETSEARRVFEIAERLEKESKVGGLFPADRLFGLLEREFSKSLISEAVATALRPPADLDLSAHKTMLALARQPSGHTKLVTTNFDRIFEACDRRLQSYTRSTLPRLQYASDGWGVVNLHGRVTKDYSAPDADGLVLSSAEFGDAYLAQGWARDFVREILDRYTAVFVGYSADDPPVRYLLEGLQQSGGERRQIYAFQEGPDDIATARWDGRGVQAIAYDPANEHAALWKTLEGWSIRAKDPAAWRSKIFAMARKGPTKLAPHERGMFAHLVSTASGAWELRKASPPIPAEWLCVLDPIIRFEQPGSARGGLNKRLIVDPYELYRLDDDPPPRGRNEELSDIKPVPDNAWDAFRLNAEDRRVADEYQLPWARGYNAKNVPRLPRRLAAIGDWIGEVALQPAAVWWAARQKVLHPEIRDSIERKIRGTSDDQAMGVLTAWHLTFQLWNAAEWNSRTGREVREAVAGHGWSPSIVRQYAAAFAPRFKVEQIYGPTIPPKAGGQIVLSSLMGARVEYPKGFEGIAIPDEYLPAVLGSLRLNLETGVALEMEVGGWITFCSIVPDEEGEEETAFSRSYQLSGHVVHFASLFRRLVTADPKAARFEFGCWPQHHPVFTRLRIWAAGIREIVNPEEFAAEILSLTPEALWNGENNRDLLLALRARWAELTQSQRHDIENRLLEGPPKIRKHSKARHAERSAHYLLSRFQWLVQQGCELDFDLQARFADWRRQAPEWLPEYAATAAESHDGRGGTVTKDTNWSQLRELRPAEIVAAARTGAGRSFRHLTEFDPFAGLAEEAPLKAISALGRSYAAGDFAASFWETLLWSKDRKDDGLRLKALIAGRLAQLSNRHFSEVVLGASQWFEIAGPALRGDCPPSYFRLWDKFVSAITEAPESSRSSLVRQGGDIDWTTEAINSPAGNLAELLMTDPLKAGLKQGQGYPKAWRDRVDQLLALPGDSRRFALVIFTFNLNWFFHIDPAWTERTLLSVVERPREQFDQDAFWAGFFWGARTPQADLYLRLKPFLLDMAKRRALQRRRHGEILAGLLLNGWAGKKHGKRYITSEELRSALLEADDQFRAQALSHLERWTPNAANGWSGQLVAFIKEVWPRQKKALTPQISARLCDLAFAQTDRFSEVAQAILPLLGRIEGNDLFLGSLWRAKNKPIEYPGDVLDLLFAVLADDPRHWPYGASDVLTRLASEPSIASNPKLTELLHRSEVR